MTHKPLHPNEIPEDTTAGGVVGWIAEDIARSLVLRLSGMVALLSAVVAALSASAPLGLRLATIAVGVALTFALLISQLQAWRRSFQWFLILGMLLVTGALFAMVVRLG